MRPRVALAAFVVIVAAGACGVPSLDLTGKGCPCGSGYTCDTVRQVCVAGSQTDGGPPRGDGAVPSETGLPPPDGTAPFEGAANDSPSCGDTVSDPANCGRCGHSCLGGTCAGGLCQPQVLAANQPSATNLAVDSSTVYWAAGSPVSTIYSCPFSGCASPAVLMTSTAMIGNVAVAGGFLFYIAPGVVGRCQLPGCTAPQTIASASGRSSYAVVTADAVSVMWSDTGTADVLACPVAGCAGAPTVVTSGASVFGLPVLDATNLYFDNGSGQIVACARTGCGSSPVALTGTGVSGGQGLAVSGGIAYFDNSSAVASCPTSGCTAPKVLASGQLGPGPLAVLGTDLYWSNGYGTTVEHCTLPDCTGGPTDVAVGQQGPVAVAVSAQWVFWYVDTTGTAGSGAVMKVAR